MRAEVMCEGTLEGCNFSAFFLRAEVTEMVRIPRSATSAANMEAKCIT